MHKYQKLNYVALTILLGMTASVSAKSFPQDYLSPHQSLETVKSVVAEGKKPIKSDSSVATKLQSSPHHIHELSVYGKKSDSVQINRKTTEMSDAKSTSTFHLFEQYL